MAKACGLKNLPEPAAFSKMIYIHCLMVYADDENTVFTTAADFIRNSNQPIFLTGKAGTGKTTFLKYIKENSNKNIVIVAPTGVAAINAGGTTIHSFFQLPFAPFVPVNHEHFSSAASVDKHSLLSKLRLNAERKEIMQQLDLLIIDEISMVRCDVLDAIDTVLRHVRNNHSKPFGGIQVLYIGDLYQLPPVVKDEEWQLLRSCYENQYFFSSKVIQEQAPAYIELQKVYRQADLSFINLLNQVRNNEMDEYAHEFLHSRYLPDFKAKKDDNYITLTTHNKKADEINKEELADLVGNVFSFKAGIAGEFYEKSFPAEEFLNIKTGAQVMFLKNDLEKVRRYYNGKIGIVDKVEEDKIWVNCNANGTEQLIEVKKEVWRNIQYSLNKKTQQVEEEELGSFTQYPLRLAWAITIHKSQGLTFEKAIIDAGNAFAPGQVYVALSRCTSIEGIVLRSKISSKSLHSDDRIVQFSLKQQNQPEQQVLLAEAKKRFEQETVLSLFDFKKANYYLQELTTLVKENVVFGKNVLDWLALMQDQFNLCIKHGSKFIEILNLIFIENLPETNNKIQERLVKAADWFVIEFTKIKEIMLKSSAVTDNRQLANEYNGKLQKIWDAVCLHLHVLPVAQAGFSIEKYREQRNSFKTAPLSVTAYSGKSSFVPKEIKYPDLYNALKDKRNEISKEKGIPIFIVCSSLSLEQMTNYLPQTLSELGKISGFGKIKLKQFGKDFCDIIKDFCELNNLESTNIILPEKKIKKTAALVKTQKPDTKKLSFELYREGKKMEQIAEERKLSLTTIENHLAFFIESGELDINELMDSKTQNNIKGVINKTGIESVQKIKEQLPDISYAEIKWAIALEKKQA